jgi:hypothetical protein
MALVGVFTIINVRPHRKRAAAAGSNLCPRREGFELYYVRLHHPRQIEGGLKRRTSLDRGRQRTFVFWRHLPGGQYGMAEEFTEKLIEKVREYVFLNETVIFAQAFPLRIDFEHPPRLLFLLQLSANRRRSSSSSELDIMN